MTDLPRGYRNNNPGNIDRTDPRAGWVGAVPDSQLTDLRFEQYVAPEFGIRAVAKILMKYEARGTNTVRKIISTYAPPNENDTGAYIKNVADRCGVGPDDVISVRHDRAKLVEILRAIIRVELGKCPADQGPEWYPLEVIERGVDLALGLQA